MAAVFAAGALVASMGIAGCGSGSASSSGGGAAGELADGTYTGKSSVLDANVDGDGYVEVTIDVEGGQIADASYEAFNPDGTLKDENYGKDTAYYGVAQRALQTGEEYLEQFLETGDPAAIDTVSGATYLHDQFVEAAKDAIGQAEK